jgi:hypothetical protein
VRFNCAASLEIINAIWKFQMKLNVSLDAGANVHVLYPKTLAKSLQFIKNELVGYCQMGSTFVTSGNGALLN